MTGLVASIVLTGCSQGAAEPERIKVIRGDITQSVNADGELSLPQQRKLTFGVSGKIQELNVKEGDKVTSGQALAKLETASLERAVKAAELAVKSAEADKLQSEASLLSAQADQKQAELGIKTAEADYQQAQNGIKTAEASQLQAENAIRTAQVDLEQANDNFRKITYPYTYSTFVFDVPKALDSINTAQRQVSDALKVLQTPGLTSDQYTAASTQLQQALDKLTEAQQSLNRGQGADVFSSELLTVKDFWTLRDAQLSVDKAKLSVDAANGNLDKARLAVDTAKSVALAAQLGTEVARAALAKASAGVDYARAVLNKTAIAVDNAGYNLLEARDTLDKATIKATFDGVIASVNVKAGDVLTPGDYTRTIFELIDPKHMEFTIKVDEMDIPGVAVGQAAAVSIDALPNVRPQGKITFVSPLPTVEGGVVQYEVKIGFDVPEGSALKSGMSSSANIVIGQRQNVLLVPTRAVSRDKDGKTVVKILVNGQAQERVVQPGISSNLQTEITSGLNPDDIVVMGKSG
ncbi:MAG: efflux RND transporter periplasmic adaptor subunit [Dehalococcoidales bacterium]|nr:efflux RND transporter periplasmic adaptor subunit [Dehalococcoidales bacterium]